MSAPVTFSIDQLTAHEARNGEIWRVVYLDGNNPEYPIVALDSKGNPNTFTRNGRLRKNQDSEFDLIAAAPVRVERWVNVGPTGCSHSFDTRVQADVYRETDRTSVLLITHENGKLVSCEMEPL